MTTFRSDAYAADSRKPAVAFGDTLDGDLVRRDFTVNAMAIRLPRSETLRRPVRRDRRPHQPVLCAPRPRRRSFSDDPLRMMRAARFVAQLGFTPAPDVVAAMTAMADRIAIVSAERIRDELSKTLMTAHPRAGLELLVDTGLADHVLPELPALRLERDEHHRHKDVFAHSLIVLEQAIELEARSGGIAPGPDEPAGRDVARHRQAGDGAVRGGRQGVVPPRCRRRAKLNQETDECAEVPGGEMKAVSEAGRAAPALPRLRRPGPAWTDSAVRRYVRDAGDQLERLHILTRADCTTRNSARRRLHRPTRSWSGGSTC